LHCFSAASKRLFLANRRKNYGHRCPLMAQADVL